MSRAREFATCVLLLAIVIAAMVLRPTYDQKYAPIADRADSQTYRAGAYDVRIDDIRTTRLLGSEFGAGADTSGLWLLVDMTFEAHEEPTRVPKLTIVNSDGVAWEASQRPGTTVGMPTGQLSAGIPTHLVAIFELPPRALDAGSTIALGGEVIAPVVTPEIPLGLTPARARYLIAQPASSLVPDKVRFG